MHDVASEKIVKKEEKPKILYDYNMETEEEAIDVKIKPEKPFAKKKKKAQKKLANKVKKGVLF